jgi:hypothetical protein
LTYHGVYDQCRTGNIVVLALCNDIPALSGRGAAVGNPNCVQVGPEVSGERVDEQALATSRLTPIISHDMPHSQQVIPPTLIWTFVKARVAVLSR